MSATPPKRWAVLIGINGYHESLGPLSFCVDDAKLMQEVLLSECCGFAPENIVLLADDQAAGRTPTFGNIHSWLGAWLSRPGPDDLVLVYFAGHGREHKGVPLLAPQDATLDVLPVTGIPVPQVVDILDRCKARQKVLILDACHSAPGRDVAPMTATFRRSLDSGTGLFTIASCDTDQVSHEWPEKGHGVFTHFLAQAIREAAEPDSHGTVTLDSIYQWTLRNVQDWAAPRRLKQEPVCVSRVKGMIPIAARPLSAEQVLRRAEAEIASLKDQLASQRAEIRRLAAENTRLREAHSAPPPNARHSARSQERIALFREGARKVFRELRTRPWLTAGIASGLFVMCCLWVATARYGSSGFLSAAGICAAFVVPGSVWPFYRLLASHAAREQDKAARLGYSVGHTMWPEFDQGLAWILAVLLSLTAGGAVFGLLVLGGWLLGILG